MGRIVRPRKLPAVKGEKDSSPLAKHIGGKLLALRQRDYVTMREVSEKCGLSNAFISQLENGQSLPSADTLWRLARAFEVGVEHFFEGYEQ